MTTPTVERESEQDTSRDRDIGRIEGRQEQGLKRLDDLIETVRQLDRKIDRYFLIMLSSLIALLSITLGGFITLANMIARIPGG